MPSGTLNLVCAEGEYQRDGLCIRSEFLTESIPDHVLLFAVV